MIKTITIGAGRYNVAQASAVEQQRLMLLIAAKMAFNSAKTDSEIDRKLLFGAFLTLSENVFDDIASIALSKTFKAGETSRPVSVDDFQGKMLDYFNLVAEAVAYNLGDVFTWLDSENSARRAGTDAKV